jgi:erythromycin esterase-like protein
MTTATEQAIVDAVREGAFPLSGSPRDYDALLAQIGDAHFVLLGEASHGTHEFYRERARITQRLIEEKGFTAVAVEADWPDAWRVNRFVRAQGDDEFATEALDGFRRFPTWMWRNTDVVDFVDWLRIHNDGQAPGAPRCGFYGLDLYSLNASIEAVLQFLDKVDPEAAARARERYACFERFDHDSQAYGMMTGLQGMASCENEVVQQLIELQRDRARLDILPGNDDEAFFAEQNARLVKNAERYYREMYRSDVSSWNLRDRHMMETLEALTAYLGRGGRRPKIVLWAHNSHLGDARATEMGRRRGELNIGQLVRERHGDDAMLVGFTTHTGTVTAATRWDAPPQRRRVRPSRHDSYEALFHATGLPGFLLPLRERDDHTAALRAARLERAIGVIYRPESERQSHYFQTQLPEQFDAVLHFDETHAVEPLERNVEWHDAEAPETYPSGM